MAAVEEEVSPKTSAELIEELDKERELNQELKAKLDQSELLVQQLKQQIAELRGEKNEEMTVTLPADDDDADSGDGIAAIVDDSAVAKTIESKEIESDGTSKKKLEIFVKKQKIKNNDLFMNERRRKLIQVIDITRFTFRGYFGLSFANRWGFYVDRIMSKQIFDYYEWISYPKGDRLLAEHASVFAVAISSDGYYLYTGSKDGTIMKCNMVDLSKLGQVDAHTELILCLVYRAGLLVSGSADKLIRIWNARNFHLIRTLEGHTDNVTSIVFNKKSDKIISGSADASVRIWLVKSGDCLKVLDGHTKRVNALVFADNVIFSASYDRSVKMWYPTRDKELPTVTDEIDSIIYDIAMNCAKSMLCCVCNKRLIIYSWPELRVERTMDIDATRCTFHPLLPYIVALADRTNHEIKMYDVRSGEIIHQFKGHTSNILSITFSPDGFRMVSAASERAVRIWAVESLF